MSVTAKIERLKNNLVDIKNQKLQEFIIAAIAENEQLVLELNRQQLEEGRSAKGKPLTPEYASEKYAQKKKALGSKAPFGTPDLKLTGDFQNDFDLKVFKTSADIFSEDIKSPFLEKKYGRQNIYGLDRDSQIILITKILPSVRQQTRKYLLLNK